VTSEFKLVVSDRKESLSYALSVSAWLNRSLSTKPGSGSDGLDALGIEGTGAEVGGCGRLENDSPRETSDILLE
jgi:hypothetical protein